MVDKQFVGNQGKWGFVVHDLKLQFLLYCEDGAKTFGQQGRYA